MVENEEYVKLNKIIGRNIKSIMEQRSGQEIVGSPFLAYYSNEWLAFEVGINVSHLYKVYRGEKGLKILTLVKIAAALDVTVDSLIH